MVEEVREIFCKGILSRSGIGSVEYSINPFTGCSHGCAYCYARFMLRYARTKQPWGKFVHVKINAPTVLMKEIKRKKLGTVLLSSVCDPYQELEKRYELTRKILQVISKYNNFKVDILTKSDLIIRDLDILKKMRNVEVGFSISHFDEEFRRIFEPGAPSVERRFEALNTLAKNGIDTYVFVAPVIPLITERDVEGIVEGAERGNARYLFFDTLNIKCGNWKPIIAGLEKYEPEIVEEFVEVMEEPESYYRQLKARILKKCDSIDCSFTF
ncbi:MAG: radical SAM protein [Candidatus Jordarchaeum sp.]|uniref:SPL family radical SAM protein n=1 Tax=Candidatus Jordarchaeum sp. TaxID=2823881 RepID=UPI0040497165